ncbi:MAG: hypothetical protein EPN46_03895 [Candidimonas sp.]|nr:MAG: hypothetical protein EPN77_09450 [Candidimonas sp.]TAM26798.1 MAG: hypothetical protein EPN62_01000 [Candidimonas sp.]TAM79269.1 MAG: hypothetical protein EPN46_03895 [Candidimonas sp.]
MAIYLIIPLRQETVEIDTAITSIIDEQDRFQLQGNSGWLVRFAGTTKEVSDKIGITGQKEGEAATLGSALVTPVTSYYGRGPADMWEWLKIRFEQ